MYLGNINKNMNNLNINRNMNNMDDMNMNRNYFNINRNRNDMYMNRVSNMNYMNNMDDMNMNRNYFNINRNRNDMYMNRISNMNNMNMNRNNLNVNRNMNDMNMNRISNMNKMNMNRNNLNVNRNMNDMNMNRISNMNYMNMSNRNNTNNLNVNRNTNDMNMYRFSNANNMNMNIISKMNNKEVLNNNFINSNDLNDMNSNRRKEFKSNRKNSNKDVDFNNNNINYGANNNTDNYGPHYKKNKSKDSKTHKRALSKAHMKQKAQSKNKFYKLPEYPGYLYQEKIALIKKNNMQFYEIEDNNAKIKEKENIIVLNHLKNADKEEEDEKNREIFDEKEKLKEESIRKYYKIENDKKKEIENCFKNYKLKIIFKNAEVLSDEKIYTKNENIIKIYDNKLFKELYNINCRKETKIKSAIELDNKDLIISIISKGNYRLLVYRLINNNYNLIQTINELTGKYHDGRIKAAYLMSDPDYLFDLEYIKKLENNRFMSVSNYEIKLYSLNKNNCYEVILFYDDNSRYKDIYEIDGENYLIIDSIIRNFRQVYNCNKPEEHYTKKKIVIKKIKLNKIKKDEKEKILEEYKENVTFKNLISSLKLISSEVCSTIIENEELSNFIILKNKYLLIQSVYDLYIFNLSNLKQLAKYSILVYGEKKIHRVKKMSIQKWKCINDNEFILNINGNITLFRLEKENGKKINLNIIVFSYFPKLGTLYRINEENKFLVYEDDEKSNSIEIYSM